MRRQKSTIFSVFGQIEAVIADAMVAEGKAHKIKPELIPPTVRFNAEGREAHCALIVTMANSQEFDRRVRELRQ